MYLINAFINESGENNRNGFSLLIWTWHCFKVYGRAGESFRDFKNRIAYALSQYE